jgi:hypothetical protein
MISSYLVGGLGNQLFIIATTHTLAMDNNDEYAFDFHRKLSSIGQGNVPLAYRDNIYSKLKDLPPKWKHEFHYREPNFGYSPIPYQKNMLLSGYLGNEKYFSHRKAEIINLFKEETILKNIQNEFSGVLKNSVSLHVRHGDYIKLPKVYLIPTTGYYTKAIAILDSRVRIDNIIVISDDIRWCRGNLRDPRITFIGGRPDYIDFYLQTLTDHNIMANSSFSWWGSYLNENSDKIVISPKRWFAGGCNASEKNIICDNWISL